MPDANTDRDPLELLAADYMDRLRQGQHPSIEDYAEQHPALAQEIRDLFPTIAMTERLKAHQARSSGGRATLGPAQLDRLGDFRLIREIGRGGMGVVFEAEQESLGRRVAVKVLPRQMLLDERHLKRFEREARIAANLHHTNIVEVFGVGEQDGFHYYVMQYIEGVGLDTVIAELVKAVRKPGGIHPPSSEMDAAAAPEQPRVSTTVRQLLGEEDRQAGRLGPAYWCNVARMGLQAAEALSYAHSQGVLHRDLKPANLLLGAQGVVWLTDFGLAKATRSDDVSLSRDVVGTLRYMPPEQFNGKTDQRSDIYSLGLTLYELIALRPAYEETDQSRLIQRIAQGPPDRPRTACPAIPPDLETIILKAGSHDADHRYPSARELAEDLRCFLEDRPIRARRAGPVERMGRWCCRNKSLATLTGTTLFLLVLVAVVASTGYIRTRNALQGEALERAKAETNAGLAVEALDRLFERLSPIRMRVVPQLSITSPSGETIEVPTSPILSREAATLLEEMLPFYDRLAQQTGNDNTLQARIADANRRVGAIRQRLGQFDEAVNAYRRALILYEDLRVGSPTDVMRKLEVAQIDNELGRMFTSRRQVVEAREAHLAALALLETDGRRASAPEPLRFELARTCYFLGTQERPLPAAGPRQEDRPAPISDEQMECLAQAVALLKALPASPPANPEYQHLLALCYLEGAAVGEASSPQAKGGAERAIEILEGLVQAFPTIPDYAYDLSEAYSRIHIPRPPIPPETERAIKDRFGKSLVLLKKLVVQYPDLPDFPAAEARIYEKLGALDRQMQHWADAEQNFRKAIDIQEKLVTQFPNSLNYGLWLATFRIALADALIRQNQPAEARTELEDSIALLLSQVKQRPQMPPPHSVLALGYSRLAMALRQMGQNNGAAEAERKAEQERMGSGAFCP